jgi:lipoprotein-anchoring transpeptidase ErfK/SrfK
MNPPSDRSSMKRVVQLVAMIATIGALEATAARAQMIDSSKVTADSVKRQGDSSKSESPGPKPAKADLRAVGTVSGPVRLKADLSTRTLTVMGNDGVIKTFNVAVGSPNYPTPPGTYTIRKIVWNPSWIPPDSKWAKKETAKGPGEPGNPMKVAKIFFKEPDYYIHGTGQVNSLGDAASHGCLRMDPNEVAELAQFLMNNGGQPREEGWFSRVIHMRWKTHTVYLSQPITLVVSR